MLEVALARTDLKASSAKAPRQSQHYLRGREKLFLTNDIGATEKTNGTGAAHDP